MYTAIHFLLTPDKSASRRLRRIIAENGARIGVMVGTWPELVTLLQQNYHLPEPVNTWEATLQSAARGITDAFWSRSLEVAEKETLASVSDALVKLLEGSEPGCLLSPDISNCLPERSGRHLSDLMRLHEEMGSILPAPLGSILSLISAHKPASLRKVIVYHQSDIQRLFPWQNALLKKIASDCTVLPDPQLEILHRSTFTMNGAGSAVCTLAHFQHKLFSAPVEKVPRDASIQWVAARDCLEEVEVAAGMIQTLLLNPDHRISDIGVLLPTDSEYAQALRSVFSAAGLPVSALVREASLRDIGRETVFHFLLSLRKPAPVKALASLVTSPLMPWSVEKGVILATRIMGGDTELDELQHLARHIENESIVPAELDAALLAFSRFIRAGEGMEAHLGRARQTISDVRGMLQGVESTPWKEILAAAAPEEYSGSTENAITREGIAIFSEREEPWRQVKSLFILGLASGHYPAATGASSVFGESDLQILNEQLGYAIETRAQTAQRRRELFRRQLMSAGEHITILMPRRDGLGETIHPSESLTFMAQLLEGVTSPEALVYDLDSAADRDQVNLLARASESAPQSLRTLESDDVTLPHNLLKLRADKEGNQKPESPSGLETLMVSPLAWLFRRYNMEPKEWAPEELDMMGKGTLAHSVFEHLFAPGKKIPSANEIKKQVPSLLHDAISNLMPFMLAPEWRIEVRHLVRDIEDAALRWSEIMLHLRADVIGVEVTLLGMLDDLPLTGNADLLMKLPGNRLYIVDYKKSKSGSRRERMKKEYDSQANLYRLMLQTGGVKEDNPAMTAAIGSCTDIGVMYYMLNDQTALADTTGWSGGTLGGFHELGNGISTKAMVLIKELIAQLAKGIVTLNSSSDEEWFDKTAATKPYALDNSPLIRLFMKQE
ncbi:MAG: PD-(D/E)XK nuclease family protein [Desulfuromonadaceae bacterium]